MISSRFVWRGKTLTIRSGEANVSLWCWVRLGGVRVNSRLENTRRWVRNPECAHGRRGRGCGRGTPGGRSASSTGWGVEAQSPQERNQAPRGGGCFPAHERGIRWNQNGRKNLKKRERLGWRLVRETEALTQRSPEGPKLGTQGRSNGGTGSQPTGKHPRAEGCTEVRPERRGAGTAPPDAGPGGRGAAAVP